MAKIIYFSPSGEESSVDVPMGESIMRGAVNNMIDGMVGECGGGLACATCHCYVDEAWIDKVGTPSDIEVEMLEIASSEVRPNSRLACQIMVGPSLEGLVVHLPETQY